MALTTARLVPQASLQASVWGAGSFSRAKPRRLTLVRHPTTQRPANQPIQAVYTTDVGTKPAGTVNTRPFLNRVRKFDSCREHSPISSVFQDFSSKRSADGGDPKHRF